MLNAYIYNGVRTPFGRNAGALAKVRPDNMMGAVIKEVVENSPFEAADIELYLQWLTPLSYPYYRITCISCRKDNRKISRCGWLVCTKI